MKLKQIYAFIARDLKLVFTDKASIFWIIVWPLIWVFMVAYVFVPPGSLSPVKLEVGVVDLDRGATGNFTSRDFIEVMNNVTYKGERIFNVREYNDTENLTNDLKHGVLDVGIIIPRGFSENLTKGIARLKVLIGARDVYTASISYSVIKGFIDEFSKRVGVIRANITLSYMTYYIERYNQSISNTTRLLRFIREYMIGIAVPVNASYEDVKPEVYANRENILGWYVVGAVGMMFLYTGFSYGASRLYREKENGVLRRILASPVNISTLISAILLSGITMLVFSAIILVLVGVYGVGAHILFNPLNPVHLLIPILVVIGAFMSIGIGVILSVFAKSSEGANSLGVALGLFLSFTAGIWFPREWMPTVFRILADYFPPTWVFDAMRKIMVYGYGFDSIWLDLVKITAALVIIVFIDIIIYKAKLHKYLTTY